MLIWVPSVTLLNLLGRFDLHPNPKPFMAPSNAAETLWVCATSVVVGFSEELLTRGYLISRLLRLYGPVKSVAFSALVFSAWHIPLPFSVAHTFIWGLVYGFVFIKIRRLMPLAIAHAVNNMIAYL
jgi:membrane protease YdiL (CAAX protease family)